MRKNRVKVSQSKPKKGTPDIPECGKVTIHINEEANHSLINIDVPSEPSFKLPVKSHGNLLTNTASKELGHEELSPNELEEIDYSKSESLEAEDEPQAASEYSEIETNPQNLIKQIQELQQEITSMTQRIVSTETAMKIKDHEAQELKELLLKLRENQVMIIESSEKQSNCKYCGIF